LKVLSILQGNILLELYDIETPLEQLSEEADPGEGAVHVIDLVFGLSGPGSSDERSYWISKDDQRDVWSLWVSMYMDEYGDHLFAKQITAKSYSDDTPKIAQSLLLIALQKESTLDGCGVTFSVLSNHLISDEDVQEIRTAFE